jgi:hypothetical protein
MNFQAQTYPPHDIPPGASPDGISLQLLALACGLLPLVVALTCRRGVWGVPALFLCFIAGSYGGVVLSGPLALVLSAVIVATKPPKDAGSYALGTPFTPRLPSSQSGGFTGPTLRDPGASPVAPAAAPAVTAGAAGAAAANAPAAVTCPACATLVALCGDRYPPWCSKCGADLKVRA